jgi:YD repeat-containing protein
VSLPHGTGSLTYQYNEYGLLKRTASSLDHITDYGYDVLGRLETVTASAKSSGAAGLAEYYPGCGTTRSS